MADEKKKVVVESTKWFDSARELVRNYDFTLDRPGVVMAEPKEKCEFCGTRIIYAARILGRPFHAPTEIPVAKRIGCDCLTRVLGETWRDYGAMESQLKTLKDIVAGEKRKAKYAETFKKEIAYLECLDTESRGWNWESRFMIDMKKILTTGSKIMSKNMIYHLQKLVERDVLANLKRQANADMFEVGEWSKRIADLLVMIEKVMGPQIHATEKNDYTITNSILNYLNNQRTLSVKQMNLLNQKWEYYSRRTY